MTQERNPYLRANSLPELLSWDDIEFVRCAFVTLIGRQPDRRGESYYLERIRRGHSKLELLWQLRRSPEGRRHDPGIGGLDRILKRAAWERKPIIGTVFRAFTRGEPDDRLARLQRLLLNELTAIREQAPHPERAQTAAIPRHSLLPHANDLVTADIGRPKKRVPAKGLSDSARKSLGILTGSEIR